MHYNYYIGYPTIVRSDYGTENASLSAIQIAFRYSHHDYFRATKSFMYGPSTSNIVSCMQACHIIIIIFNMLMHAYKVMLIVSIYLICEVYS